MENYPRPNTRRLRIFSFDPALAAQYDLAGMSGITIEIPWEDNLKPGPVGEYIEVVDIDPARVKLVRARYPFLRELENARDTQVPLFQS